MKFFHLIAIILMVVACKPSQPTSTNIPQEETQPLAATEETALDPTPDAGAGGESDYYHPIKDFRGSRSRSFDLLHTKLSLRFDWSKQQVIGSASLRLVPYYYPQDLLILDAKSFEIGGIYLLDNAAKKPLKYEYQDDQLYIALGKTFTKNEIFTLEIDYIANPNAINVGGSEAITEDKGLYFINPLGENPYKPRQIWTQGETTANSAWFPTIDAPNERCTQEMYLTVADTLTTLSNGLLVSTVENGDGTKTDYWKMDQPHAPYLFMLAVGDFARVEDRAGKVPLAYYVEPEYEEVAKDIFGRTPEMIQFFSEKLKYPYPWPQYNQVVVRDFVSGAMENTTATVFMEELQMSRKELRDENWDYIIAHELFHHWFGDLVTCESWSNLAIQEGFADYSEALWIGHRYGQDEGDYHAMISLENYFEEAEEEQKDLIRYYYDDKEDMFDRHSYEKGGAILRMLQTFLGEDAFFDGLNYYLKKHAYQSVEVHDLRLAFEHVTGEDLNWFFNQWFLSAGHPILQVEESYEADTLLLNFRQVQNFESFPLFKIPLFLELYHGDEVDTYPVVLNAIEEEIKIPLSYKPDLIVVDGAQQLVGEINFEQSAERLLFQINNAKKLVARYSAFEDLAATENVDVMKRALPVVLKDRSHRIITLGLDYLQAAPDYMTDGALISLVKELLSHEKAEVRSGALYALMQFDPTSVKSEILTAVNDSSYSVQGVALEGVLQLSDVDTDAIFKPFLEETQLDVQLPIANYVNQTEEASYFEWYQKRLKTFRSGSLFYLLQYYAEYILTQDNTIKEQAVPLLKKIAIQNDIAFTRYSAYQILFLLKDDIDVEGVLREIRAAEKDEQLLDVYSKL